MTDIDSNVLIVMVFAIISAAYSYGFNPLIRYSRQVLQHGKNRRAVRLYSLMLMIWPHPPELMILRGYALIDMGKTRPAMNDFERALQQNPDRYSTHKTLGDVYAVYEKDFDQALGYYNHAIELEPRMNDAHIARAQLRVGWRRDLDLALVDCNDAIQMAEPEFREHRELGTYIQHGEQIAAYYGHRLVQLYTLRALISAEQGEVESAQADFASAESINAEQASLFRATMLMKQKEYHRVIELLQPLTTTMPTRWGIHQLLGNAWYCLGDYDAARAAYDQALEIAPKIAVLYNNRAESHLAAGALSPALADFQAALALHPSMLHAQAGQAVAQHALGEVEPARKIWHHLLERDVRFANAAWVGQRLNWTPPIIQQAQRLTADL